MLLVIGPIPIPTMPALCVTTPANALPHLTAQPISIILTTPDFLPPTLTLLRENQLTIPTVAIGPAQPATGAKCIRLGALEYLTTPPEPRLLKALLAKFTPNTSSNGPIASDPVTLTLLQQAKQFSQSSATVLLRGESGTGKEVIANFIHQNSPRKTQPFIAVNCAAIPENLLESELFGHTKGAFSGAVSERKGKFQQAQGGTLLLDEISEMDLNLQAKLLRAIQEKTIDPIGADKPVPVDIRLIATTNRQLENYVAEGKFREDLYFRLSVITLDLPPLRERPADILPLAQHFLHKHAQANGYTTTPRLNPSASQKLQTCYWKGNVRELENTTHRAILLAGPTSAEISENHILLSPMSLQHMPIASNNLNAHTSILPAPAAPSLNPMAQAATLAYGGQSVNAPFIPKRLSEIERETLAATLTYTQGNKQYAADLLGISLTILTEKLTASGLAP